MQHEYVEMRNGGYANRAGDGLQQRLEEARRHRSANLA